MSTAEAPGLVANSMSLINMAQNTDRTCFETQKLTLLAYARRSLYISTYNIR